ncbi:MAG: RDD family protein [Pirellulaceae bacterium]
MANGDSEAWVSEQRQVARGLVPENQAIRWDVSQQLDTTERIVTPENIAFEQHCAGIFSRGLAFLIDVIVFAVVWLVMLFIEWMLALAVIWAAIQLGVSSLLDDVFFIVAGVNLVVLFVSYWLVWGWTESRFNGRTLGKLALGIRTVSVSGHPINGWQAMVRSIVRGVELMPFVTWGMVVGIIIPPRTFASQYDPSFLPLYTSMPFGTGLIGLLFLTLFPRFQRLGDIVAGTMVVYDRSRKNPGLAELEDPRTAALAEFIPTSFRPRRELVKAISVYVHRRARLSEARRSEIAGHIAKPLLARFGMLPDTNYDLLICAIYYRQLIAPDATEKAEAARLAAKSSALRTVGGPA